MIYVEKAGKDERLGRSRQCTHVDHVTNNHYNYVIVDEKQLTIGVDFDTSLVRIVG